MKRVILIHDDGTRDEFQPDPDGILWSYETPNERRWIEWRALAEKIEQGLEPKRASDDLRAAPAGDGADRAATVEPHYLGREPRNAASDEGRDAR